MMPIFDSPLGPVFNTLSPTVITIKIISKHTSHSRLPFFHAKHPKNNGVTCLFCWTDTHTETNASGNAAATIHAAHRVASKGYNPP